MDKRTAAKHGAGVVAGAVMLWIAFKQGNRVPLLGLFDLGMHELGHMMTVLLGRTIHFVMGSGTQVLVPLGLAAYFWLRLRDPVSTGVTMCWAGTSFQDVSVYIADAPYQHLPLIGGGTHDWAFLLGQWGRIGDAAGIARTVWMIGLIVGLAGVVVLVWRPTGELLRRVDRRALELPQRRGPLPVRPPRTDVEPF